MGAIKTEVINTMKQIGDLADWLTLHHASPLAQHKPTMYIDLEGVNLCREGSVSIFTLLIDTGIPTTRRVCLVDVHSLGSRAFSTTGIKSKTLKDILQDKKIPKVFFDVRNDSDALFAHFGVALQGVEDVQLMESAARTTTGSRRYLNGLAKCVEDHVLGGDRTSWQLAKTKGERLFKAEHGGSFEVFNQRPMPDDIISYCVGDVQHLPELRDKFWKQTNKSRVLIDDETKKRVAESQKPEYQPHGRNRALAPWSQVQNRTLDGCNYVPPPRDDFDGDYFNDYWYDWHEGGWSDDESNDCRYDNDFEDWTRADWQGPPS
jgi:exonuclease 3'-5' domain-containing protein 1